MGIVSDLFANDRDGSLRRHVFRVISTLGYVFVLGMMLFLGGLVWRMFTGAEVEIFGIRVANPDPPERITTTSSGPVTPVPPTAPPIAPPAGQSGTPPLWRLLTAWVPMTGGLEECMQVSNEALNRAQISAVQRLPFGWTGHFRKEGTTLANTSVRCIPANGFAIAFVTSSAASEATNSEVMDAVLREYNIKTGNVPLARLGGAAPQLSEHYSSLETNFENITACRDFAKKVYEDKKAQIRSVETSAVFSQMNGVRTSALCIRDAGRITVMITGIGFWSEEAIRVRDLIVRDFQPVKRVPP